MRRALAVAAALVVLAGPCRPVDPFDHGGPWRERPSQPTERTEP